MTSSPLEAAYRLTQARYLETVREVERLERRAQIDLQRAYKRCDKAREKMLAARRALVPSEEPVRERVERRRPIAWDDQDE